MIVVLTAPRRRLTQGRLTSDTQPGGRRAPPGQLLPCGSVWGRRTYLPLAGAFAVAALAAVGCGGSDSAPITPVQSQTGDQGPPALSKTAFITQADSVCGEANAALSALDTGTAGNDPKLQATEELQITRTELQSLQSLTPPNGSRSALDRFLSALEDQVTALAHKKTAVDQGGDTASAEAEASAAVSSAQSAAQDYGFKDCANASQAPTGASTTTTAPAVTTTTPTVTTPTTPTTTAAPPTGGTGGGGTGGGTGGGGGGGTGGGTGGTGGGTGGTGG
jgi:hypothetical protein